MKKTVRQVSGVSVTTPPRARNETASLGVCRHPDCSHVHANRIIVIGGNQRVKRLERMFEGLRVYPSTRSAGLGSRKRARATIDRGSVELVLVLCRWIGHSDDHAIAEQCQRASVRLIRVRGAISAVCREIRAALGER